MKILDRYIIRQFLINFVILTIVFMTLFMLVDFISDSDEFVEAGHVRGLQLELDIDNKEAIAQAGKGGKPGVKHMTLGTLWVIVDWFGPLTLLVFVFLSGLLVTGAMGFTFVSLVRNREIIAMVGSGVSMYRIAAPLLVTGVALNLLTFPLQEWLVPPLADKIKRRKHEMKYDQSNTFAVEFALDEHGNLISAGRLKEDALENVTILVRGGTSNVQYRIMADTAYWNGERNGWELIQGHRDRPLADLVLSEEAAEQGADPVEFYQTELGPKLLMARRSAMYARLLSSADLLHLQRDPLMGPLATKLLHSRFSLMVVSVLVLIMGLPFFMLRLPANMVMQSTKAAGICIGAWASGLVLLQVGTGTMPPVASAWLPVVIYLPVSAILLQLVKT